ncbi:methyl-accepting chemotaxis protein [Moorena bouillonii]|uniref:methyl-accepting chemotaxis protein n=1 Tax=Moorena bouillonii TaxID=207920 RepID=UPI0009D78540|nr:methyl-accepting chemotaxis protein [Moorena bouillonii]
MTQIPPQNNSLKDNNGHQIDTHDIKLSDKLSNNLSDNGHTGTHQTFNLSTSTLKTKLGKSLLPLPKLIQSKLAAPQRLPSLFLKWFYNLPIQGKQLLALFTSEVISVVGLAGVGAFLIITGGRAQLINQAKSELAVMDIIYNIKINQMGFGFRGQSDNSAIIKAVQTHAQGKPLTPGLFKEVKDILQQEIQTRRIEYATLVGKDRRIIVNANSDRTAEFFDPNDLVSQVLENPQQIKTSELVSWSEVAQESPFLPAGIVQQNNLLIRYTVTPVRTTDTGAVLGVLVSGDIVNGKLPIVEDTLKSFGGGYSAVYLRQPDGQFLLATALDQGKSTNLAEAQPNVFLPDTPFLNQAVTAQGNPITKRIKIGRQTYTVAAKTLNNFNGKPVALLVRGTSEAQLNFLLTDNLLLQLLVVILALTADILLAILLGRAIAKPIQQLQNLAEQFAQGSRHLRSNLITNDEIGKLARTFNEMAESVTSHEKVIRQEADRTQVIINFAATSIDKSLDLKAFFQEAVEKALNQLNADRVVIYRLNPDGSGYIGFEAVQPGWPKAVENMVEDRIDNKIEDACIPQQLLDGYKHGRVVASNNVFEAGFHRDHEKLMERLQIKANLVTPIVHGEKLYGLLIAHHCTAPHQWQESEIIFLTQLSVQLGNVMERATSLEQMEAARQEAENLAQEQRQLKEDLQKRALELLMEVEPVSKGDLTIRAHVTADELGTIADSYNATIESLRKLVLQVQQATKQVTTTTTQDEAAIRELSTEALRQAEEIANALQKIHDMTVSTRSVAVSASEAEAAVKQAAQTVEAGDAAMNLTVEGFMAIRETVGSTAKKVKRLGESSQKISKVVNLISGFAEQTNMLALNAAIEAARAGEAGRGFAVVADEVRALAHQSAEATAEIEKLVADIQAETNEVAAAMEEGTEQVVVGTKLVDDTRQSLNQITAVTVKINELVKAIAITAVDQTQASESVTETMADVAAIANRTSTEVTQVSNSFKQLLKVAEQLQDSVGKFKVS